MFGDLKQYINNRIALAKLEVIDSVSNMLSAGIFVVVTGMVLLMLLFVGSLSLGFFLGKWMDNTGIGFLLVMGIYILLLILLFAFRKQIKLFFTNKVIEAAMEAVDPSEDEQTDE